MVGELNQGFKHVSKQMMDEEDRKSKVQAGKEAVSLWYSCTTIRCEYRLNMLES